MISRINFTVWPVRCTRSTLLGRRLYGSTNFDLSIFSVALFLLAPLRSSHSKRVPPSISFCLSSKLKSLSSLFVFRRPPLHPPSLTLATLLLSSSFLRSLLSSPFPLRSLSLASCLPSTLRFLSSSKIGVSLFPRSFSFSPVLSVWGSHFVYD